MPDSAVPSQQQETQDGHHGRRLFRRKRLQFAFATSALSKAAGLVLQVVVVPATVHLLGVERFGLYTMLMSGLAWMDLARVGIGPGLTRMLAVAWNEGDEPAQRSLFSSALLLLTGTCGILIAVGIGLTLLSGDFLLELAVGNAATRYAGELRIALVIVAVFFLFQILTSAAEAARSAYQEEYANNLSNGAGNVLAIVALAALGSQLDTIPAFAGAILGATIAAKLMNFGLLLRTKPLMRPKFRSIRRGLLTSLMHGSLAFWLVQLGAMMTQHFSMVLLGSLTSAVSLTPYAVLFRLLQLASTVALMFALPLWPAIADAAVRSDHEWIRAAKRKLLLYVMSFSIATSLVIAFFGDRLIDFWSGEELMAERSLCVAMALYFSAWMWNYCHAIVLFGKGRLWPVAFTLLGEGCAVLLLGSVLIPRFGNLGAGLSLCIATIGISAWILPILSRETQQPKLA